MAEKETMADFEAEINASLKRYSEGDMVKGVIAGIENYVVYVDLGTYMQGIILPTELSDDPSFNMMDDLKIGDKCYVIGRIKYFELQIGFATTNIKPWWPLSSKSVEIFDVQEFLYK